jgi:uncharacterized membrane protein
MAIRRYASPLTFAVVFVSLGVQGLVTGRFTAVWAPVSATVPARELLIYLCALVSLITGLGLCWPRSAAVAARVLFGCLALWWLTFRVREIVLAPSSFPAWDGCAETTVMLAGAWALARVGGRAGLRAAGILFGLSLVAFGLAHFVYPAQTAALVPQWLPAHLVWVYLTGSAFLAAAVAVLTGVRARMAASLAALQIGLFTLLVWVPILVRGSKDPSDWSEFAISAALTAASWVVADSYVGAR